MDFGVHVHVTSAGLRPAEVATTIEASGLDSVWVGDHSHFPLEACEPELDRGPLEVYTRFLDQFVVLSAMASATERIRIGSGVCLVPLRDPLTLANEVASLDVLSGGRFDFGIGAGWNRQEILNHGVAPERRFGRMRESIELMKRLWSEDVVDFEGTHISVRAASSWPKPAQAPHPPVLIGGRGPKVLDRVFAYGDAWGPDVVGGLEPIEALRRRVEEFVSRRTELGRGDVGLVAFGAAIDDACVETLAEMGFDSVVFSILAEEPTEVREAIDQAAALAQRQRSGGGVSPAGAQGI